MSELSYNVATFRQAGLTAKWTKTSQGAPIIALRNPAAAQEHQRDRWWVCDDKMFSMMKVKGIVEGFNSSTVLGNMFRTWS